MIRRAIAVALLAAAAMPLAALEKIGEITWLDGKVELVRDGAPLASSLVKEGLDLANFDLLKTGSDGEVELRISSPAAAATTIRVSPRTQFCVEIGNVGSKQQTTIDLVIGSVAMKCAKLTDKQTLRVLTEGTLMGVRGTSFVVDAAGSGDLLVTCDEGEVECSDEKGATIRAVAGEAVERRWGGPLGRFVLKGVLAQARREWLDGRIAELKGDLLARTRLNRGLFSLQLQSFNRQFAALMRYRKTFDAWGSEDRVGSIHELVDRLKDRRQMTVALWRIRTTLSSLERTYARLLELRDLCAEQHCSGRVGVLQTSEAFFRYLDRQRARIELRRALVRWYARQFAQRNDGRVPGSAFDAVDWTTFFEK